MSSHIVTMGLESDIVLTADTDADGVGGVLIRATADLESSRDIVLTGSDLFLRTEARSIEVESIGGGVRGSLSAARDALLLSSAHSPVGSSIVVDGVVTGHGESRIETVARIDGSGLVSGSTVTLLAETGIGTTGGLGVSATSLSAAVRPARWCCTMRRRRL